MNLGQFLSTAPVPSAPKKEVHFWVTGQNKNAEQVMVEAHATFRVVTVGQEQEALNGALKESGKPDTHRSALAREELIQFLAVALRDYQHPRERFATADELRAAISWETAETLQAEYLAWEKEWYPKHPTNADKKQAEAEAKNS